MAALRYNPETDALPPLPPLRQGERLSRPEFHARYEAMPPGTKVELIGGTVHVMPSPVSNSHSRKHAFVVGWLMEYERATPGVLAHDNPTLMLGAHDEPQPDACLRLADAREGRSHVEADFIHGPPELVVEIALASAAHDLGRKLRLYEQVGVREYLVILPHAGEAQWLSLDDGRYQRLRPAADGILRSRHFLGLWLDAQALLAEDLAAFTAAGAHGLASAEHAQWAKR